MNPKPDPELVDDENPEWTEEDFARAVPFSHLPPSFREILQSTPRIVIEEPAGTPAKCVLVPVKEDVVAAFQATGLAWEQRINQVLCEWVAQHDLFNHS